MYISRHIQSTLKTLLAQFSAVLVTGARQVGKSTMLQEVAPDYQYLTFDDPLLFRKCQK